MKIATKQALLALGAVGVLCTSSKAWAQLQPPLPSPAGQDAGQDVIVLKNGGILRGTIIDAIPNQQARIRLSTGEIAVVVWSEIQRIDQGKAPASPAGSGVPGAPAAPAPSVYVHVESPTQVSIEAHALGAPKDWVPVCDAPCNKLLPTDGYEYRIVGPGVRDSRNFRLVGRQNDRVDIDVDPGSKAVFVLSIVGLSIAAPTALIALLIAAVEGAVGDDATGALIVAGVSGVVVVGSIVGMVTNKTTGVDSHLTQARPAPPTARIPEWRTAFDPIQLQHPSVMVPIWTVRF